MLLISVMSALLAALIAAALTYFGAPLARRFDLVDAPERLPRKVHRQAVVLIGGLAILFALLIVLVGVKILAPRVLPILPGVTWGSLVGASGLIFLFGIWDDRRSLPAGVQLGAAVLAVLLTMFGGILVTRVTNPTGGVLALDKIKFLPALITFVWLLGMMYSTKLLDGLDGLATSMTGVGALMIFALSYTAKFYEPRIGFLALVLAGACLGFLFFNWHPARAFLGDGGSVFLGFALGVLAIMSGSKIATTLLVMGWPVFDVARVAVLRAWQRRWPWQGDQSHLHYLLLRSGWSQHAAVAIYLLVGASFGISALWLQSKGKIFMLLLLVLIGWLLAVGLERGLKNNHKI